MWYRQRGAGGSGDFHIAIPDPNETSALEASRVAHRPYPAPWKPSQHPGFLTTPSLLAEALTATSVFYEALTALGLRQLNLG